MKKFQVLVTLEAADEQAAEQTVRDALGKENDFESLQALTPERFVYQDRNNWVDLGFIVAMEHHDLKHAFFDSVEKSGGETEVVLLFNGYSMSFAAVVERLGQNFENGITARARELLAEKEAALTAAFHDAMEALKAKLDEVADAS